MQAGGLMLKNMGKEGVLSMASLAASAFRADSRHTHDLRGIAQIPCLTSVEVAVAPQV